MRYDLNSKNYYDLELIDNQKRDLILVIPGGAYINASDREAGVVAEQFKSEGYHHAIYNYREEQLMFPDIHLEAKELLSRLKQHPFIDKVYLIGFSAGGHFAAMLSSYYYDLIDKLILCYPVITANPRFTHAKSFINLLGQNPTTDQLEEVSMEKHLHHLFPPTFIMHTMQDKDVPVENSLIMVEALKTNHVYVEAHLYPTGPHGISVATKDVCYPGMEVDDFINQYGYINDWVRLAKMFLKREIK